MFSAIPLQVVREKLYRNLHQEVPYNVRVMPLSFKELADGSWRFEQNIVVATNHVSHLSFSGPIHLDVVALFLFTCL